MGSTYIEQIWTLRYLDMQKATKTFHIRYTSFYCGINSNISNSFSTTTDTYSYSCFVDAKLWNIFCSIYKDKNIKNKDQTRIVISQNLVQPIKNMPFMASKIVSRLAFSVQIDCKK